VADLTSDFPGEADRGPLDAVRIAYRRYAPVYDVLFGAVFDAGRRQTCRIVNGFRPARVLEVGVGTGLSLPLYGADTQVVGIDVSPEMLERARRRVALSGAVNVRLHELDAAATGFPSASFDVVVACYVLSVTPDPRRVLAEMRRLSSPGGAMVICNHTLGAGRRSHLPSWLMKPLARKLGWRPDFNLFDELQFAGIAIRECRKVGQFGMFTVLICTP
jgi:phosphatidylethanolamine/phosphatidyl-N-methylethanolamine N-methyltransferase